MTRHYCTKHCPSQKVVCHNLLRQRLQDDVIQSAVQQAGKAKTAKMVPGHIRQGKKEDCLGVYASVLACNFLEWRDLKVVYNIYANLYFCCTIKGQDNELTHRYVELLDKSFGSVCELMSRVY